MINKRVGAIIQRAAVVLLLLISAGFLSSYSLYTGVERGGMIETLSSLAVDMRVKNLVTVVYLGPRIFDTFLEVIVVILTVFGIKALRSNL